MSGVYWGALMNAPNPGQAFADSFNQGMERNRENAIRQREMALREQQHQAQLTKEQEAEWKKYAGSLAQWADTPEKWDQAVDYLAQSGYPDAAQLKGKFSPGLRAHFMAQAGISPPQPAQDPSFIREADILGIPRDEAAQLWRQRQGMIMINGVPHVAAPQSGPQPGTVEDGYRFKGGNPADPNAWEKVGGPTPSASGAFPATGN